MSFKTMLATISNTHNIYTPFQHKEGQPQLKPTITLINLERDSQLMDRQGNEDKTEHHPQSC